MECVPRTLGPHKRQEQEQEEEGDKKNNKNEKTKKNNKNMDAVKSICLKHKPSQRQGHC